MNERRGMNKICVYILYSNLYLVNRLRTRNNIKTSIRLFPFNESISDYQQQKKIIFFAHILLFCFVVL